MPASRSFPKEEDVAAVGKFFGLLFEGSGDAITHSLVTAVISPSGRIESWHSGNDWTIADVIDDLRASSSEEARAQAKPL